ncbi:hypothetical protein NUSPORA_02541 [Nucleospora cyclopteri]
MHFIKTFQFFIIINVISLKFPNDTSINSTQNNKNDCQPKLKSILKNNSKTEENLQKNNEKKKVRFNLGNLNN